VKSEASGWREKKRRRKWRGVALAAAMAGSGVKKQRSLIGENGMAKISKLMAKRLQLAKEAAMKISGIRRNEQWQSKASKSCESANNIVKMAMKQRKLAYQ
jgi:hypothetical protein